MTKVIKPVIFQDIFIWKAVSQKLKVEGGKSVHFLNGLFKKSIRKLMLGEWFCQGHRNTDLHRIWRNRVFVEMNAVFHLKEDCSEIL